MPTLLKIWKTGKQEGLARKDGAARTSDSYSIPEDDDDDEDDDEDEDERQPVYSVPVTPSTIPGATARKACRLLSLYDILEPMQTITDR